jgi:predicted transposase YbfD/YdcC
LRARSSPSTRPSAAWLRQDGCNPTIAQSILDADADYLLAVKDNQPTLHAEVEAYFDTAPAAEVDVSQSLDKGHGRLEIRVHEVSKARLGQLGPRLRGR